MPSLPDTLQVLLARFVSMAWRTVLDFLVLGLPDIAQSRPYEMQKHIAMCELDKCVLDKLRVQVCTR